VAFYGDVFRPDVAAGRPDRDELIEIARRSGLLEVVEEHYGAGGMEALGEEIGREVLKQLVHQLGRYFADDEIRRVIRSRLSAVVTDDTRVIVAHSMGTVVAYEELAAHPDWGVHTLVTLGSPLGGEFVFPHLDPEPVNGVGAWPGSAVAWTNVVALDDTVVRVRELAARFGSGVNDILIDNGHRAHDAEPYLNALATGRAIAAALNGDY
jgi:pimeloyl-ACP methyl ester carboxylesterase